MTESKKSELEIDIDQENQPLLSKESDPLASPHYRTTWYRWVILLGLSLSFMSSVTSALTLNTVAVQVRDLFDLPSTTLVNLCAISFTAVFVPGVLVAVWALKHYSIVSVLTFASLMCLFGQLIRYLTVWTDSFGCLLTGAIVISIPAPFFQATYLQVVNLWFPDNQRSLAVGLLAAASPLGNATTQVLNAIFYREAETDEQFQSGLYSVLTI